MTIPSPRRLILAFLALAACSQPDQILSGDRVGLREVGTLAETRGHAANRVAPIALPAQQANAAWTHRGGSARHAIAHPALPGDLTLAFATRIGAGDSRRARITADPVVAGSTIFAMDARSTVSAVSSGGAVLWQADVRRALENPRDASGGGLAYADGVLYVTTGYGQLIALDAATGGRIWVQDLGASGGSAPTVAGDLVYVSARDSRGWAVERTTGRIRWTLPGVPSPTGFGGGAGPAVSDGVAVFPFSSGEVVGTFAEGGRERWSTPVVGRREGAAIATISEVAGDPVIVGDTVYAGNVSGRLMAISLTGGDTLWTSEDGAANPVWPAGGALFLVNDLAQLLRVDAATGAVVWRQQLPVRAERRGLALRRDRSTFAHYGPVLAGGRLIVASSDGVLREFDPRSGAMIAQTALPGGATTNPAVANGTLYVVSADGQLLAVR